MSSRSVVLFVKHSFVFWLALVFGVLCLGHTTIGQTKVEAQRAQAKGDSAAGNRAAVADNDYSKKIKEYTTEPYFMTELRHQTQGSFFMLFNAALNFDSLNTERATPPARTRSSGEDDQ